MKTPFLALFFLVPLAALGAAYHAPLVDTNGGFLTPSKATFLRQNVLNQQGITRQVDFVTDLNAATSPYRSGEHVLVIDAAPFGSGGPVLFFHDSGSSDPTNTVDTFICTAGGRWKAKRLYSGAIGGTLTVAGDTGNPVSNLVNSATATFVRTNGDVAVEVSSAIPRLASSNAFTALQYFQEGIHVDPNKPVTIGGVARTNWPTSGTGGSITVAGDTGNPVSNLVNSATTSFARTNGDVAVEITQVPATTISGTIDILRLPSEVATDSEVAASMGALTNGTGTLSVSNLTITGTLSAGSLTVPTNAYSAAWATNNGVPTKRDLYDKIETLGSGNDFGTLIISGRRGWPLVDDFMGGTAGAGDAGSAGVNIASGVITVGTTEPEHHGIRQMRVGAVGQAVALGWGINGRSVIFNTNSATDSWIWESESKSPARTSGGPSTHEFGIFDGFMNYAATTAGPTDGVYFAYQTNLFGTTNNWIFVTTVGSTSEAKNTGVLYAQSTWQKKRIVVTTTNAVGYIDGVAVATNTIQIPYGVSLAPHIKIVQTLGALTTDLNVDAIAVDHKE